MITAVFHSFHSLVSPVKYSEQSINIDVHHPVNDINEEEELRHAIEADNAPVGAETNEKYAEVRGLTDERTLTETNDAEEARDNPDDHQNVYIYQIFYETLGIFPIIFAIYWPLFFYVTSRMCNVGPQLPQITEPRVPQPK